MGGVVKSIAKPLGLAKSTSPVAVAVDNQIEKRAEVRATQAQEEQGARLRGARRRGRQLLSDSRLNPEAGVETLGGGQNLG